VRRPETHHCRGSAEARAPRPAGAPGQCQPEKREERAALGTTTDLLVQRNADATAQLSRRIDFRHRAEQANRSVQRLTF
jgi:hypothetical protein